MRGILCTFLVNFFEIVLPPFFPSLLVLFSLSLLLEHTLPRLHEFAVCYRLAGSIERTTRHSCNCSCSRIFPFLFVPSCFSILLLRSSSFILARSNANDRARPLWTPQLRPVQPFSCENDCCLCLMGSVEFLSDAVEFWFCVVMEWLLKV